MKAKKAEKQPASSMPMAELVTLRVAVGGHEMHSSGSRAFVIEQRDWFVSYFHLEEEKKEEEKNGGSES